MLASSFVIIKYKQDIRLIPRLVLLEGHLIYYFNGKGARYPHQHSIVQLLDY